jgi:phage-related protein
MASIYDTVPTWGAGSTYIKYDIVKGSDNKFYYSVIDSNFAQNPITPSNLQVKWDGYISLNSVLYPNFWWKPSYNSTIDQQPSLRYNQFGNGYIQRIKENLNSNLLRLQLTFEDRSEKETVSILHFLNQMGGQTSFVYTVPTIYSKSSANLSTKFICPTWSVKFASYNNYSINLELIEVPI